MSTRTAVVRSPLLRCLLPALTLAATPFAATGAPPTAVHALPKPATALLGRYDSQEFIEVKFTPAAGVGLRGARLSSTQAAPLATLDRLFGAAGPLAAAEPLFRAEAATLSAAGANKAADAEPGLSRWYRLRVRPGHDIRRALDALNASSAVEIAYPAPLPAPPPDYSGLQYYRGFDNNGIGVIEARDYPNADGTGVRVLDIEYSWNTQHEDLSQLRAPGAFIPNGTLWDPFNDNNHGTAVMGMLIADDNRLGVTGMVDRAQAHFTNAANRERGYDPANAVAIAANALRAGDVIVIEQQTAGPAGCSGYVPLEWIPSVYDAIVAATHKGVHVVEAAGNGGMNLDNAACFGSPFPRGRPSSGALIVGAGSSGPNSLCDTAPPARSKLSFSTYGARVNVHGWGNCVVTTGYGDIPPYAGANSAYTWQFSGTSSATPMVAATVVAISAAFQSRRGQPMPPQFMHELVISGGRSQIGDDGHIGPMTNALIPIKALSW
ncbi:S8 family serine peptidase [Lysobacter sp. K5869]|uniref:S8 family serine peptidase n=1 Tax=Lysobacter sp. K5869 TaxID=2820808 RepID=UPI001C060404|nr:S8 family serine peptidase [Lysobacter sp. K5869]QWP75773.1 S8 family serine peptidase [Lysobacter sp. K5869]